MRWTADQEKALAEVRRWLRERDRPVCYVAGYAGTGKTELARAVAEEVSGVVRFGAPTGIAAAVLRQRGCEGATTFHRLIYRPKPRGKARLNELEGELAAAKAVGTPRRVAQLERELAEERLAVDRPSFETRDDAPLRGASLLVLDEASMVGDREAEDLLGFGVPILALGDPAQLPPVRAAGYFTRRKPDCLLTEVRRQALDSPVLALATAVRAGDPLRPGPHGDSLVCHRADVTPELALTVDQVLTGHNRTRRAVNRRTRQLQGRTSPYPEVGDRLVSLGNRHELGVWNGSQLVATEAARPVTELDLSLRVTGEDLVDHPVQAPCTPFDLYEEVTAEDNRSWRVKQDLVELDYAYALTVHKGQGSQWPSVLVLDDGFGAGALDRRRWLYTAVTRASERVVVALKA